MVVVVVMVGAKLVAVVVVRGDAPDYVFAKVSTTVQEEKAAFVRLIATGFLFWESYSDGSATN